MATPGKRMIRLIIAAAVAALIAPLIGYLCGLTSTEVQITGLVLIGAAILLRYSSTK